MDATDRAQGSCSSDCEFQPRAVIEGVGARWKPLGSRQHSDTQGILLERVREESFRREERQRLPVDAHPRVAVSREHYPVDGIWDRCHVDERVGDQGAIDRRMTERMIGLVHPRVLPFENG